MANKLKHTDIRALVIAGILFVTAAFLAFPAFSQDVAVNPADTNATQSVVGDQLNAFRSGDTVRAYSHAAPNVRSIFPSVDRFSTMVKNGYGAIWQSDSYVFGRNTVISGEIYQEVIITDPAGKQWQAVYTLKQQEDGSWKITGVKMNPYTGAST
jgi:hypothetical protein